MVRLSVRLVNYASGKKHTILVIIVRCGQVVHLPVLLEVVELGGSNHPTQLIPIGLSIRVVSQDVPALIPVEGPCRQLSWVVHCEILSK